MPLMCIGSLQRTVAAVESRDPPAVTLRGLGFARKVVTRGLQALMSRSRIPFCEDIYEQDFGTKAFNIIEFVANLDKNK